MKAQILKHTGLTEKQFYAKYKTQKDFENSKEGKAFKKAQFGTLVGGATPKQTFSKPLSFIDFDEYYDMSDKTITGSTQEERDKLAYDQAMLEANAKGSGGGGGGMLGGLTSMLGTISGGGGGEALGGGADAAMPDMAMALGKYGRRIPVAQNGIPPIDSSLAGSPDYQQGYSDDGIYLSDADLAENNGYAFPGGPNTNKEKFNNTMDSIGQFAGKMAGPVGQIAQGFQMLGAEKDALRDAKQAAAVSEVTRRASATREEQSKRRYVRPEDIQNTGEEFFPIYGVGTNVLTRNGGAIKRAQDGSYIGGNPTEVQNTYGNGNSIYDDLGYAPLIDPFKAKTFRGGGGIPVAQSGFGEFMSGDADPSVYGQVGNIGTNLAFSATGGKNGGGQIGSTVGGVAGTLIGGPVGGMIGSAVGGLAGNLLDTNPRDTKKQMDIAKSNTTAMALNSAFQGLEETHNRYVRNGGGIPSYEDGGYMNPEYNPQVITMFGDHTAADFADYAHKYRAGGHLKEYTPPSERAMETFAMGGQLETHWGGDSEVVSYNPHMPGSGQTVKFTGNSHTQSDGKGNTGIGISYGKNPVEVEDNETMYELASGGEVDPQTGEQKTTGIVLGNMVIDKNVASKLNDPELMEVVNKYHGKKFKNIDFSKDENKQNKVIAKTTDAINSLKVEDSIDKAALAGLQLKLDGADMKLAKIANEKIMLANFQNSINDAKDELSEVIGQNLSAEDLARGYTKLDKDPVTMNAKWGGNIEKAQDGTTASKAKTFKSEREANAQGYYKDEDGKYRRKIKKFSTKESETKSADALGYVPSGQKQSASGLWGKVTPQEFDAARQANSWFDWNGFNPKRKADVENYQKAFNARAQEMGSAKRITVDGDFGEQTVTARVEQSKKAEPVQSEEELTAIVEEPAPTEIVEEKAKFPWLPLLSQGINYLRPSDVEGLDYQQLYPEWYAMATNQVEPVPAQSYQPELIVPYDISLQAQRNAVLSNTRALSKQVGYNPSAQSNIAPAEYNAINEINEKEFIANQGLKNQVYTGNVNTMNEAKKINLALFADQWGKQSQARSNTKATTQAALNSIADKYAKHKLENRTLSIYENMYNYRFGKSGRAQNWNPLQFFDTTIGGAKTRKDQDIAGLEPTRWDKNGDPIAWKKASDKNTTDDNDYTALDEVGKTPGIGDNRKNGGSVKKNNKNSSILRAFKNL